MIRCMRPPLTKNDTIDFYNSQEKEYLCLQGCDGYKLCSQTQRRGFANEKE